MLPTVVTAPMCQRIYAPATADHPTAHSFHITSTGSREKHRHKTWPFPILCALRERISYSRTNPVFMAFWSLRIMCAVSALKVTAQNSFEKLPLRHKKQGHGGLSSANIQRDTALYKRESTNILEYSGQQNSTQTY